MDTTTVVINARDRFSTFSRCLETLFANTPEPIRVIAVLGGAPEHLRQQWLDRFGDRVEFIFEPNFLNQAQARNIALRRTTTRVAVVMDNDVFVRPGWLEPLVRCQRETGAAMVVPVILETPTTIHTAGNDLYITYTNGKAYGHKELRFHSMAFLEGSNLRRRETDYGELHCQLVEVEPSLKLGVFDEQIREVGEVDFGLTCSKAGRAMWCEPESVVLYALHSPVEAEDAQLFAWRWDMRGILDGFQYFERKWDLDITECGGFRDFLLWYNGQLGLLPRLSPTLAAMAVDRLLSRLRRAVWVPMQKLWMAPVIALRRYKAWRIGYYTWPRPIA